MCSPTTDPTAEVALRLPRWRVSIVPLARPLLRPFVAVSDAQGVVHQVIDERVQPMSTASVVFRRAGCCAVPYCIGLAANAAYSHTLLLCELHVQAAQALCPGVEVAV